MGAYVPTCLHGSTSALIHFASSGHGNDMDTPCPFILLTKSMQYYPIIQKLSVLAQNPTSPSVDILLVVITPAPDPIIVTPTPSPTLNTTLRPRGGNTTCGETPLVGRHHLSSDEANGPPGSRLESDYHPSSLPTLSHLRLETSVEQQTPLS